MVSFALVTVTGCSTPSRASKALHDAGNSRSADGSASDATRLDAGAVVQVDARADDASTGSAQTDSDAGGASDASVDASTISPPCALRQLPAGPDYTLSIDGGGHVANLVLSAADFQTMALDARSGKWAGVIASLFRDDFDFYIFVMNQQQQLSGASAAGRSSAIHSHVSGNGSAQIDTAGFEARPRLKQDIFLGRHYDLDSGDIYHEIAHTWANYLSVLPDPGFHWPEVSDVGGALGGVYQKGSIQEVSPGTYTASVDLGKDRYADLELYLMGVMAPSQVGPVHWLKNPVATGAANTWTADALVTTTVDDVIAAEGPRVPDHLAAQHDFSALPIVVSTKPLIAAEWNYFLMQAANFSASVAPTSTTGSGTFFRPFNSLFAWAQTTPQNFHEATLELATMRMSGLVDALVDPAATTCVPMLPNVGNGCVELIAKAKQCGVAPSECRVDLDFDPVSSKCIGACATNATCADVVAANQNLDPNAWVNSDLTQCVLKCQP